LLPINQHKKEKKVVHKISARDFFFKTEPFAKLLDANGSSALRVKMAF
jgi:hypothetical protein